MPQGIIRIDGLEAFKDHFDLTIDPALIDLGKLKEALLLPERYTVEQVIRKRSNHFDYAEITVSSPDIHQGYPLPNVTPIYLNENREDGKTKTISLNDILINGVSAIREEDKERKVTIDLLDLNEPLMNCDVCDRDVPESTLISIGEVLWKGEQEMEMFICEDCAEKVSNAFAKRKETVQ